jgi:hypothetical protein
MGPKARLEYAEEIRRRYERANRAGRGRLLTEFTAVTGYHRKYAIALLNRAPAPPTIRRKKTSRFDEGVVAALAAIWRAADYPWSRRLIALLPLWMPYARKRLQITERVESLLLGMSARSADRVLQPHRVELKRRLYGRTKPGTFRAMGRTRGWLVRDGHGSALWRERGWRFCVLRQPQRCCLDLDRNPCGSWQEQAFCR